MPLDIHLSKSLFSSSRVVFTLYSLLENWAKSHKLFSWKALLSSRMISSRMLFSLELFSRFLRSRYLFSLTSYPVMASLLSHSSYLTWSLFLSCTLLISRDTLPFSWTLLVPSSLLAWTPLVSQHFSCDLFLPLLLRSLLADLFSSSHVIASFSLIISYFFFWFASVHC